MRMPLIEQSLIKTSLGSFDLLLKFTIYFEKIPRIIKNKTMAIPKGGNAMAVPSKAIPIAPVKIAPISPPAPAAMFRFEAPKITMRTITATTAKTIAIHSLSNLN